MTNGNPLSPLPYSGKNRYHLNRKFSDIVTIYDVAVIGANELQSFFYTRGPAI